MERSLNQGVLPVEIDLCNLLRTMKLSSGKRPEGDTLDVSMHEEPNGLVSLIPTASTSLGNDECESYGCEYLQTVRRQLGNHSHIGGEYLETIFTHREILLSFPAAHHQCAQGFNDLAYTLEQRAWRADRKADTEAIAAFRHEAWSIAASLPSTSNQNIPFNGPASHACMIPAM